MHREGGLNLERLLVASRRLGSEKMQSCFSNFGWEKNKLGSMYQTQAVELQNGIKIFTQNVSHFWGGEGGPRQSETCLTFGQIFFLGRSLRVP